MINILKRFLNSKYLYILIIIFLIVLFLVYNPLLRYKSIYMENKTITDFIYLYYVFIIPMSFYEEGLGTCLILETMYISVLLYIVVSFINYFFNENATTTITRIDRETWIKSILNINLIFSILYSCIYILYYYLLCTINGISIVFSVNNIIPVIYKILISISIPNIYIFVYIKTNNLLSSLGFSIFIDIIFQIIIRNYFNEQTLLFSNVIYIILFLILSYLTTRVISISSFKRRDI